MPPNLAHLAICGDTVIWKPSLLTPLISIATNRVAEKVAAAHGHPHVFKLIMGADDVVGHKMVADRRLPLISATGSTCARNWSPRRNAAGGFARR